jgi:hypothetical protein
MLRTAMMCGRRHHVVREESNNNNNKESMVKEEKSSCAVFVAVSSHRDFFIFSGIRFPCFDMPRTYFDA